MRKNYPSLKDRVVIVTGGGRGLGREMALELVAAGAKVLITGAEQSDELAKVVRESSDAFGQGRLLSIQADISDWNDTKKVRDVALEYFGAIHCLVNNAGRGMLLVAKDFTSRPALFWEAPPEGWCQIITTNVNGSFLMSRAIAPVMVEQGFGRIINVSTSLATMSRRGYSSYGPSKAALEAASVIWAKDLQDTGVTVNILLPGGSSDTKLLPDGSNRWGADGELLSPRLMRAPILWLCSDDSQNSTGLRYIARLWDNSLSRADAAKSALDKSTFFS